MQALRKMTLQFSVLSGKPWKQLKNDMAAAKIVVKYFLTELLPAKMTNHTNDSAIVMIFCGIASAKAKWQSQNVHTSVYPKYPKRRF